MSDCAAPRPISSPIEQPATGRILIVEAEHETRRALHGALHERGFDVLDVSSGDKALGLARTIGFDAVILGISVPVSGGIEACRELRRILPLLGIIAVGPRVDEAGRIAVLDSGADDYVVKPYLLPELTSRIRACVRHVRARQLPEEPSIRIGEIALYPVRRVLEKRGRAVGLTPKEFSLLSLLMRQPGVAATYEQLLREVWGAGRARNVDFLRTLVRRLRRKIEDDLSDPKYLLTENHVGYYFAVPDAE